MGQPCSPRLWNMPLYMLSSSEPPPSIDPDSPACDLLPTRSVRPQNFFFLLSNGVNRKWLSARGEIGRFSTVQKYCFKNDYSNTKPVCGEEEGTERAMCCAPTAISTLVGCTFFPFSKRNKVGTFCSRIFFGSVKFARSLSLSNNRSCCKNS